MDNIIVKPKKGSGRFVLVLLILIFLAPIAVALLWQPTGFVNHGDLIQPARSLEPTTLKTLKGEPFSLSGLNGKWTLSYLGSGECSEICQMNLYNMRQVRLAQGKNTHRVSYAWIVIDSMRPVQALLAEHPGLTVLTGAGDTIREVADQFQTDFGHPLNGNERIYLIDPIGNLMMSYSADIDPSLMLKDLKRLLQVSQLG